MAKIICNAISYNMMLPHLSHWNLRNEVISAEKVKDELGEEFINACGHSCELINSLTGLSLEKNRITNKVDIGDVLIIAQYNGPRLEEGATSLPEGATLVFVKSTVEA